MNKDKILEIINKESNSNRYEYTTEEMVSVVEYYIKVRKGQDVTITLNKPTINIFGISVSANMQIQLTLLQQAFDSCLEWFLNNKDKI